MIDRSLHTCPEGILVSSVVGEFDSLHIGVLLSRLLDELPSCVTATVIHEEQSRLSPRLLLDAYHKIAQDFQGLRQYLLLIITWNYDIYLHLLVESLHHSFYY